jgi:hypothetical protein
MNSELSLHRYPVFVQNATSLDFLNPQPAPKTCSRRHLAQTKSTTKTDLDPRQPQPLMTVQDYCEVLL